MGPAPEDCRHYGQEFPFGFRQGEQGGCVLFGIGKEHYKHVVVL
jgi:hypothetical protein